MVVYEGIQFQQVIIYFSVVVILSASGGCCPRAYYSYDFI